MSGSAKEKGRWFGDTRESPAPTPAIRLRTSDWIFRMKELGPYIMTIQSATYERIRRLEMCETVCGRRVEGIVVRAFTVRGSTVVSQRAKTNELRTYVLGCVSCGREKRKENRKEKEQKESDEGE